MATLQDEIADTFFEMLRDSPVVTPAMVDGLRELLSTKKRLTADDLVRVFSSPRGGDVE